MKNHHLMVLAFLVFLAASCHDSPIGDSFADDLYVPIGTLVTASNVQTGFFDLGDPNNSSIAFDLSATGESISTTDIVVSYNGGAPVTFKAGTAVPGTVSVTFNEALSAVGLTVAEVAVDDSFRFLFDNGSTRSSNTLDVRVSCRSELAGTYNYLTSSYFTYASNCDGETDLTGTVTISEVGAGVYVFDDWSFGTYDACYGGFSGWGTLQMTDVCNRIQITGTDSFGDSWEFEISEVNGADWNFTYSNTYGEFGVVTLTRTDGSDWPPLSN
ncbi:MAG: hypothetical protein R2788_15220 [Saprospiraceae bacterium]